MTEKCSFIFRRFEMMEPARKRVLEEAAFQKHRKLTKKFKAHTRSLTSPIQGMVCGTQEEEGEGLLDPDHRHPHPSPLIAPQTQNKAKYKCATKKCFLFLKSDSVHFKLK